MSSTTTGRPAARKTTAGPAHRPVPARRRFQRRFARERLAVVAFAFLVLLVIVAIFGPWLQPYDPDQQNLSIAFSGPGGGHWLGTDQLGRDVLSRIISGTRVSLVAAAEATGVGVLIGVPIGIVCGYFSGWFDRTVMAANDAVMALPALILAIAVAGALGPGLTHSMLAIGIVFAPRLIRLVRASVLDIRHETFIEASATIGTPTLRILRKHVLPNVLSPLIVSTSLMMAWAMVAEAGLSFLGLGVQPPQASWGAMLGQGYQYTAQAPALIIYPGVAIMLSVLALNLLSDGIRDSLGRELRRK
ncbi:ABC transporter permease [Amycolatopsis pithecellobii]|uniref:ABC transporter permease subunit n=1 Tax=Amycolatopsis pithecellobii TaxID=664692 RepID=A0A6N7Z808_9PSEU|nr:ABC transporter permease [Amycolatopsis pithecellobii]MTD57604.1 ABC transporter permease subunit [Amycolatopsis pithecellobii]